VKLELLYHVREDDSVVGPVERKRAHSEALLHRAGMVFLKRSDGKVLVQRRSQTKDTFPGAYDSSCSFHVRFGETYDEAAQRELAEETGITSQLTYLGKFTHFDPPENEIVAVFACQSDEVVKIDPDESSAMEFWSKQEVDSIVDGNSASPWLRDAWKLWRNSF
jgi:isopentenyl-diphosphate delta-isomerase